MFVHAPGRKLLLAQTSGHGFITLEDEAVAMKRSGKQVMNIPVDHEVVVCRAVQGDSVAVVGENRKLLIFPLSEVPEMAKGRGVLLQRYHDGGLMDATTFVLKTGLKDQNNRCWSAAELKDWRGQRAQTGRLPPKGFAKSGKFA